MLTPLLGKVWRFTNLFVSIPAFLPILLMFPIDRAAEGSQRSIGKPFGRARRHEILLTFRKLHNWSVSLTAVSDQGFAIPQFVIVALMRSVTHWASASLRLPLAALGSAPVDLRIASVHD